MGDGIDEAAIDQRQPVGRERSGDGYAVGAVPVEEERRRAVERRVLAVEQRDRHQLAVVGRRQQPAGDVVGRVVARGHLVPLAEHPLSRRHVVIVDAARRGHRRIGEAERVGRELVAAKQSERVRFLVEGDAVFLAGGDVADHDAGQTAFAFEPDEPVPVGRVRQDQAAVLVRDQVPPVLAAGRRHRRGDDLEVLGIAGIGQDVEDAVGLVDFVLLGGAAGRDQPWRATGIVGRENVDLRRLMVVAVDDEEPVRLGLADAEEVGRVGILEHHHVLGRVGAHGMPEDLRRAVVGIEPDVEQRPRIRRPDRRSGGAGDPVGEVLSGVEVADADLEIFRAHLVGGVGEEAMVGTMGTAAEMEIGLALGHRIGIEEDGLRPAVTRRTDQHRVLGAVREADSVGIGAVGRGHRGIVLLDPRAHLGDERVLEPGDVGHRGIGEAVLEIEIGADVGSQRRRLAHHLLPVVGSEPGIVVSAGDAEMRRGNRSLLGKRRPRAAAAGTLIRRVVPQSFRHDIKPRSARARPGTLMVPRNPRFFLAQRRETAQASHAICCYPGGTATTTIPYPGLPGAASQCRG